jgi:hypothetical protein
MPTYNSSYWNAKAISPSDTEQHNVSAVLVGGPGTIVADMQGGGAPIVITLTNAPFLLPIAVVRVRAASTATNIIGLY